MFLLVVAACCPCRQAGTATAVADKDSTYTAHHDIVRITMRDTMTLQPLAQWHERVKVEAKHSHLENAYCASTASVDEEGMLTHTLDTRDSALLPSRVVYRDRVVRDTIYRFKDRIDTKVETIIKIERKVHWYDKIIRVVCIGLAVVVLWQNRKRIMTIFRLWRI